MERISAYQWLTLMVFFQIGSTVIFGFSTNAGRDAWIVAIVSNGFGLCVLFLYGVLMRMQPGLTLVQWFPRQFGKLFGIPVAWLYPLIFLYIAGRVLRDIDELISLALLKTTPQWVVLAAFLLVVLYCLQQGFENIARLSGYIFPVLILGLFFVEVVALYFSGAFQWKNLLPIGESGAKALWNIIWPLNVTVPYGESIAFAMFWTQLKKPKDVLRLSLIATFSYGALTLFSTIITIAALDEPIFKGAKFPFFQMIRLIDVGQFISNLDPIVISQILVDAFFKITVFMAAAIEGIQQLSGFKNRSTIILGAGVIVLIGARNMARNISQHQEIGLNIVPKLIWVPCFICIPLLLLVCILIRSRLHQKAKATSS
ncbi:spore germination protein [Fodinisporobacter ferrooxydans]|uniref:Spore germination protein n=1 Tax=Fodinisporobacter ferrooxydans TaxID=2901836 RepID=A0ABY4CNI7_9BACL|nr:spore germination protein [Alicyclobacillaceae bacterium MYW30-H2]